MQDAVAANTVWHRWSYKCVYKFIKYRMSLRDKLCVITWNAKWHRMKQWPMKWCYMASQMAQWLVMWCHVEWKMAVRPVLRYHRERQMEKWPVMWHKEACRMAHWPTMWPHMALHIIIIFFISMWQPHWPTRWYHTITKWQVLIIYNHIGRFLTKNLAIISVSVLIYAFAIKAKKENQHKRQWK